VFRLGDLLAGPSRLAAGDRGARGRRIGHQRVGAGRWSLVWEQQHAAAVGEDFLRDP
jgi:hypothetical protein